MGAENPIRGRDQDFFRMVAKTTMWEIEINSVGNGPRDMSLAPGQVSLVGSPLGATDESISDGEGKGRCARAIDAVRANPVWSAPKSDLWVSESARGWNLCVVARI